MRLILRLLGRTPLGWIQLAHSPLRFAMASAGVGFAVILVFMQLGFMNMLFDTATMFHRLMKADIVIVNSVSREFHSLKAFGRRTLVKALGVPGVQEVNPLYVSMIDWVNPATHDKRQILVMGVDPHVQAFTDPVLGRQLNRIAPLGSALFDESSRGEFKPFIEAIQDGAPPPVEVAGKTMTFEGTFRLGASFGIEGTIVVSDATFQTLKPKQSPGSINLGLITVRSGEDAAKVASRIAAALDDPDIHVFTRDGFIQHTRDFMIRESPIAYIFGFGVAMGLIVGIVVVVQILSTDVQDHMPEYATFKAIGFSNGRLRAIVLEQASILTVFGFVPGLLTSLGLYALIGIGVSMPLEMPLSRVGLVLVMTIVMCGLAGMIALRRVAAADPAEVFA